MWSHLGPRRGTPAAAFSESDVELIPRRFLARVTAGLGGNYRDCLGGVNAPRGSMFLHTIAGFSATSEALACAIRGPDGTPVLLFRSNSEDLLLHLAIYHSADSAAHHSLRARLSSERIVFRILWNTLGSSGTGVEQTTLVLFKFAIFF